MGNKRWKHSFLKDGGGGDNIKKVTIEPGLEGESRIGRKRLRKYRNGFGVAVTAGNSRG